MFYDENNETKRIGDESSFEFEKKEARKEEMKRQRGK